MKRRRWQPPMCRRNAIPPHRSWGGMIMVAAAQYVTALWAAAICYGDGHTLLSAALSAVGIWCFVAPWRRGASARG